MTDKSRTPSANYYCTWQIMEWLPAHCEMAGLQPRDVLCDELLFGADGIAVRMHPQVRERLYFLVDDGWDVRSSRQGRLDEELWLKPRLGSCQISAQKFPGYGDTPPERLKTLADKVKALGWRGLGVWISPTVSYGTSVADRDKDFAAFWKTRLEWSKYAGVAYWKVDWGSYDISDKHKKQMMTLKNEVYPELIFENAFVRAPMNPGRREGLFQLNAHRHRLSYSDVLRTYDVTYPLSIPTTLSRVAALLCHPPEMNADCLGLINAEDELYLDAVLGLSMGVMRYDIGENPPTSGPNIAFGGTGHFPTTRPVRKQLDELCRAVRWQLEAPAFSVALGNSTASKAENCDRWRFTEDQSWKNYYEQPFLEQSAPRIVARNVNAPELVSEEYSENMPYLIASRNPNGALAIATLGRVAQETGYYAPRADVRWSPGALSGVIGIFGEYRSLTLTFDAPLDGKRIYAKDLAEQDLQDITEKVETSGNTLRLSGELIRECGLSAGTDGDFSEPGMLLQIGERADFAAVPVVPAKAVKPPLYAVHKRILVIGAFFHSLRQKREHKQKIKGK